MESVKRGFERSKIGIERGIERYSPYVKKFGKRVGEMMKDAPEKVGAIAKYTTHKIGSISDAIDDVISSPLGEFVISQMEGHDNGISNDIEQIRNLNRFIGGVAHGTNDILNKDYIKGVSRGFKSYKQYEKDSAEADEKFFKSEEKRKRRIANRNKNNRNEQG